MDYRDAKKKLTEGKQAKFSLTKGELSAIIKESYIDGVVDEKQWHRDSEAGISVMQADPFYVDPAYECTYPALPYSFNGKGKPITREEQRNVTESGWGMRLSRTGELTARGNKHLSQEELFLIQDAAYLRAHTDPLGASIIGNFINFVIGRGVQVDCFVPEIEAQLRLFRRQNDMDTKEMEMVKNTFMNGEFFLKLKSSDDRIRVYGVPPQNVVNIEPNADDFNEVLNYEVLPPRAWNSDSSKFYYDKSEAKWIKDIRYFLDENTPENTNSKKADTDEFMQFIKIGNYDEVRGRSPFQPILRYLKYAEDYTIDRMRLNHERSKVIMIKYVSSGSPTQDKPQVAPRGGIVLIANENTRYEFLDSHIDADDSKEDGMWILHHIGAGIVMPIHILQQRADQGAYASIKKMDTPFTQNILRWQDFFERHWLMLDRFVIKKKVADGKLKKSYEVPAFIGLNSGGSLEAAEFFSELNGRMLAMVMDNVPNDKIIKEVSDQIQKQKMNKNVKVNTEDIPVNRIFPDTVKENPLEIAKVLFLHTKMGLVSMSTAARKAGYDWRAELNQMMYEKSLGINVGDPDKGEDRGVTSEPGRAGSGDGLSSGKTSGINVKV